jgi:hypothetical protein
MATARKTNPSAAEALGDRIPVSFGGVDYLVTTSADWPYEALEAYEDGKIATFLRHVLGDEQHAAFKATRPRVATVNEFVDALTKALGVSGN